MRTPYGKECQFFYGDYFRGRKVEECRLIMDALPGEQWKPDLCATCPVPDILLANSCPHMILEPKVTRPFPFVKRKVEIRTACSKSGRKGFDPHIGCGVCHPLPPAFSGESRDTNTTARS